MARSDQMRKRGAREHAYLSALWELDAMLLLLTCVGGSVDAITYLGLGHVFTANVTGNTILLGIAIGQGLSANVVRAGLSLLGFCMGAAIGGILTKQDSRREDWPGTFIRPLAIEAVLLTIFATLWYLTDPARPPALENLLIGISGLAMGLQSVAVLCVGVSGVVTTYISGTWATFIMNLVHRFQHGKEANTAEKKQTNLLLQFAVLLLYGLVAVISGLGELRWPRITPLLPLLIVMIVVVNASIRLHHTSPRGEIPLRP
jgi:uncharacterized membrane protein YoaK (UPF0700 family)